MTTRVGINGFGRIGRVVLRIMIEHPEQFDICGINLRKADLDYMVYMIKYDSVFRQFNGTVEHKDKNLIVNGHTIQVFSESDAAMIPWSTTTLPSTSLSVRERLTLPPNCSAARFSTSRKMSPGLAMSSRMG